MAPPPKKNKQKINKIIRFHNVFSIGPFHLFYWDTPQPKKCFPNKFFLNFFGSPSIFFLLVDLLNFFLMTASKDLHDVINVQPLINRLGVARAVL